MPSLKQPARRWIKTRALDAVLKYRRATWRNRSLPHFIVIGAQKSGTTSLSHYLSQHPRILRSLTQEVHFFDGGLNPAADNYENGQQWYRAHFPSKKRLRGRFKTFEVSPLYIFNPLVPGRIIEHLPDVKLIALLRNPTERAISHYFHERRKGRESLSIEQALQAEDERLQPVLENAQYKSKTFINCSYKLRGIYKVQLERFYRYFPPQRLLVLSSEEFFTEPEHVLRRVFDFVGVDSRFEVADLRKRNVSSNREQVDPRVYADLNEYFLPHNQALYELVGKSYGWE